jgi:hypothetical protein
MRRKWRPSRAFSGVGHPAGHAVASVSRVVSGAKNSPPRRQVISNAAALRPPVIGATLAATVAFARQPFLRVSCGGPAYLSSSPGLVYAGAGAGSAIAGGAGEGSIRRRPRFCRLAMVCSPARSSRSTARVAGQAGGGDPQAQREAVELIERSKVRVQLRETE